MIDHEHIVRLYKAAQHGLRIIEEYVNSPNVPVIMEDTHWVMRDLEHALYDIDCQLEERGAP